MDPTSGVKRLTYRLDLGGRWSSIRKVGCHDYTLMAINNTNLYLLRYQPDNCFSLDVGVSIKNIDQVTIKNVSLLL